MRVIVIGGGVAGAAAALALRKTGAEVAVYEAYRDPAGDVGSFVSLAANGLRGLELLGCLAAVQEAGIDVPRQRMWSAGGMLLGDVPRGRRNEDGLHSVTLLRGRLVEALRTAAIEAGAEFVYGSRLIGAAQTEASATAEFANGETATADLIVGADGIWSALRGAIDPAAPSPVYAGLYTVSGVAQGIATDQGVFNMTFARGGAFIHVAAGDEVWWAAQINDPVEPGREGIAPEEWLERTKAVYAKEAEPSRILAAATGVHPATLFHALDPVQSWHRGRLVLIGDAAHPVGAGQGASMAIEDAISLADALSGGDDIAKALDVYAATRRPRVEKLLGAAEDNRGMKRAGPLKRRFEAAMMKVFVPLVYEKATGWLYDYRPVLNAPK